MDNFTELERMTEINLIKKFCENKDPITLIDNLCKTNINDDKFTYIIRIIISMNIPIFINKIILLNISQDITKYPKTFKTILKFYEILIKTLQLKKHTFFFINSIKLCKKSTISNKSNDDLIYFLKTEKIYVNALFDDNYGKNNFLVKIKPMTDSQTYESFFQQISVNEMIHRLELLFQFLGEKFFKRYNIKTIKFYDFHEFDYMSKFIYVTYIYKKINLIYQNIISKTQELSIKKTELTCFLDPKLFNIEIDEITDDFDEILVLFED
jgi:hypothetical protein